MNRAAQAKFSVYQSKEVPIFCVSNEPQDNFNVKEQPYSNHWDSDDQQYVGPQQQNGSKLQNNGRHSLLNNDIRMRYSQHRQNGSKPAISHLDKQNYQRSATVVKSQVQFQKQPNISQNVPNKDEESNQQIHHSNISSLHRILLDNIYSKPQQTSSSSPFVEIFNKQQHEYNKVLQQMLGLKEQNARLVDLLSEQHLQVEVLMNMNHRILADFGYIFKTPSSTTGDDEYGEDRNSDRRRGSSYNQRIESPLQGKITSHEIINTLNYTKFIFDKVQRYMTQMDIQDLRCMSQLKKIYEREQSRFEDIKNDQVNIQKSVASYDQKQSNYKIQSHHSNYHPNYQNAQMNEHKIEYQDPLSEDDYEESSEYIMPHEKQQNRLMNDKQTKSRNPKNKDGFDSFKNESSSSHEVIIISQDLPDDQDEEMPNHRNGQPYSSEEDKDENFTPTKEKKQTGHKKQITKLKPKTTNSGSKAKKSLKIMSKKPISKVRKHSQLAKENKMKFQCSKCNEVFHSGWALGGHASRVHPGESMSYKRKIQRRDERVLERQLLQMAKQKHFELYGNAPLNRVKIRKFKKELKRTLFGNQSNGRGSTKLHLNQSGRSSSDSGQSETSQ